MATLLRKDKIQATYVGNLESMKHTADMKNGMVCHVGDLVPGETEVKQVVVPDSTSVQTQEVVLHGSPAVSYDGSVTEKDWVLKAGEVGRFYHLTEGDIFTVTSDLMDATYNVGDVLMASPTMGYTANANARTTFKVIEKTTLGYDQLEAYVLQVLTV